MPDGYQKTKAPSQVGGIAADQLRSIVARAERLHEEKKVTEDDLKEVFAEARANGYDVKAIKHIIKLRRQDQSEIDEFETVVDVYLRALGMRPDEDGTNYAHVRGAREAAE